MCCLCLHLFNVMITLNQLRCNLFFYPVPNPPEKIESLTKSTSSIVIRWQHAQFKADSWLYVVTYVQSNQAKSNFTNSPNYTFSHLNSGTPYNFSVATEGPLGLQSCSISISNTTSKDFNPCTQWHDIKHTQNWQVIWLFFSELIRTRESPIPQRQHRRRGNPAYMDQACRLQSKL